MSSRYRTIIRSNFNPTAIKHHQKDNVLHMFPIVMCRIVDYVEGDFLNIYVDDLLHVPTTPGQILALSVSGIGHRLVIIFT